MTDAKLTIAGDSEKAQAAIVALEKKIDKLENGMRQVSRRTKSMATDSQSWTQKATAGVASYAASFVSLAAAVSTATAAIERQEQIRNAAAQKQRDSQAGLAQLAQLANTPEEMKQLVADANTLFSQGVGKTLNEAGGVIFSLVSAGVNNQADRALFAQLASKSIVGDAALFARAATTLKSAVGEGETGGYTAIASKAFAASAYSPATAEALLEAASRGGGSIARLGMTDESLLAATAIAATSSGTAEVGGTQIAALLKSMEKSGEFQGMSFRDAILKIQSKGLSGEELFKYFGRAEAVAGYDTVLKNLDTFDKAVGDIRAAEQNRLVNQKLTVGDAIPQIIAAQARQQVENKIDVERTDSGTLRNLREAAYQEVQKSYDDYGMGAGQIYYTQEMFARRNPLRTDRGYLENAEVQRIVAERNPELSLAIKNVLERMSGTLESIDRKTNPPERQLRRNE